MLLDTNFINFSIRNKIDVVKGMLDCLYAQCTPILTDCVMAELEKLGEKYRVALKIAKDPRIDRLPCTHAGTYADDCICDRVKQHRCYIVATCDRDLRRRIRKIPGVPIMYIQVWWGVGCGWVSGRVGWRVPAGGVGRGACEAMRQRAAGACRVRGRCEAGAGRGSCLAGGRL